MNSHAPLWTFYVCLFVAFLPGGWLVAKALDWLARVFFH